MDTDLPQQPGFVAPHSGVQAVELAQGTSIGAEPVGQVSALQGSVSIIRTDGTRVQAGDGEPIPTEFPRIDPGAKISVGGMTATFS